MVAERRRALSGVDQFLCGLVLEVRQLLGEAQRLEKEAQRAEAPITGQVDPRVINKCPTFTDRDTEWR